MSHRSPVCPSSRASATGAQFTCPRVWPSLPTTSETFASTKCSLHTPPVRSSSALMRARTTQTRLRARVIYALLMRRAYRGLARDLDLVRAHLREHRPRIASLPIEFVPFELLFQITLCGGARDDARAFYGQIVSELETIVIEYLSAPDATVADTL